MGRSEGGGEGGEGGEGNELLSLGVGAEIESCMVSCVEYRK